MGCSVVIFGLSLIALLGHVKVSQLISATLFKVQFVPAIIGFITGTGIAFVFLVFLTLCFGRVYCSFLCPLGVLQDIIIQLSLKIGIKKDMPGSMTGSIFDTLIGYGLSELMLPQLLFQNAHCDFDCNACGKSCPTGAITDLHLTEKRLTQVGTASLNKDLCVVHVKKKHCGACGEACPTKPKAIVVSSVLIHKKVKIYKPDRKSDLKTIPLKQGFPF